MNSARALLSAHILETNCASLNPYRRMATSIWRGFISFGLISIPVRLFKAARMERIALKQVYKVTDEEQPEKPSPSRVGAKSRFKPVVEEPVAESIAPIRRVASRSDSAEILDEKSVLKGFEFEKDRFITIDPEELKALEEKTATHMEILEFVKLQDVDPIYFETSYYIRPDPGGEKPFALLFEALRRAGLVGLGRLAMHRREHITLVRSGRYGLVAHTMYYSTEVRSDEEFRTDTSVLSDKEIQLADTLVRSLAGEFEPEKYHDSYKQKLEELIASKVAGQTVAPATQLKRPAPVVDIMEALKASLSNLRKPVVSEKTTGTTGATRSTKRTKAG